MGFTVRPSAWEVQHVRQISAGQAYQASHSGQLPNTPVWRMLEFRYSVNAARFSHYHPNVAQMIQIKNTIPTPSAPVPPITPPPSIVVPEVPPPIINPPVDPITPPKEQVVVPPPDPDGGGGTVVPEPATFGMLIVAVVMVGMLCCHLTKRAPKPAAA